MVLNRHLGIVVLFIVNVLMRDVMAQDTRVSTHTKALGSSDEAVRDTAIRALVLSGPKSVAAL